MEYNEYLRQKNKERICRNETGVSVKTMERESECGSWLGVMRLLRRAKQAGSSYSVWGVDIAPWE